MQFIIQFKIVDGDDYTHIITAPINASSKENAIEIIKTEGLKDVNKWKTANEVDPKYETIMVDICGERIFGNDLFLEPKYFRLLTLDEWFNLPLKGDSWILEDERAGH